MRPFALLAPLVLASGIAARTFTVRNNCPFTIWPAIYTNSGTARPDHPTGWEARAGTGVSFFVPDNWVSGRIWGRRNCNFANNPGPNSCLTGGCNGGLQCAQTGGTGVPPATLAEFRLSGHANLDFYDVSMVDGYNLPMRITNNKGCPVTECAVDLGPNCPGPIKGPFDNAGFPVGCKTACSANLDGNPLNSRNCCSGNFNTPQTCPSSGVQFYDYFKRNCPLAYAYAYDDQSSTFTCNSGLRADYTVTFCP
ncbi:Osmotin thaumatin-like protein [Coprinopsis marcescibilis]|uniref:Osmotin thaumatin-like protein n=1 Tax=Coprinopsis marcescibilis TaxID=230819 RepID=A0A5C3KHV6_COPMA|nr:Osmotin thaumatin-like protein [Coprinopsis marcescibilis]